LPHITIEYVIMLPILILQIFLFPVAANSLMNVWVDSRRTLALQDIAGHLGSTVQQLFFSLNHASMATGTATYSPGLPPFIDTHHYTANATLRTVLDPLLNSSKILDLTVSMANTQNKVTTSVVLGPNVDWQQSTFFSNSTHACVSAMKFTNGTIRMGFGE